MHQCFAVVDIAIAYQQHFFANAMLVKNTQHWRTVYETPTKAKINNFMLIERNSPLEVTWFLNDLKRDNIEMSEDFLHIMDKKCAIDFTKKTNIKTPNREICLRFLLIDREKDIPFLHYDEDLCVFGCGISVSALYIPIKVCWRSHSKCIYKMTDTNIDENDIEFWIDGLDPVEVYKELYPKADIPFNIKNLSFEFKVVRWQINAEIELKFKSETTIDKNDIDTKIGLFIEKYNDVSEANDREEGVVHNYNSHFNEEGSLIYSIDLGSAGVAFYKKLAKHLSKMDCFKEVIIY